MAIYTKEVSKTIALKERDSLSLLRGDTKVCFKTASSMDMDSSFGKMEAVIGEAIVEE